MLAHPERAGGSGGGGERGRLPPINHTASEAGREVAEGKWKEDAWWGNERCP